MEGFGNKVKEKVKNLALNDLNFDEVFQEADNYFELLRGLSHEVMEPLLKRFTEYFQNGAIAFDAISKSALGLAKRNKSIKATGAAFGGWYVDSYQLQPASFLHTQGTRRRWC